MKINLTIPHSLKKDKEGVVLNAVKCKMSMATLVFKIKNDLIKYDSAITTRGEISQRATRSQHNYDIMYSRLTLIQSSFFCKGFELFNQLEPHIRNSTSLLQFKNELKRNYQLYH